MKQRSRSRLLAASLAAVLCLDCRPPEPRREGGGPLNPLVERVEIDVEPPEGLGAYGGSLLAAQNATATATLAFDSNARVYGEVLRSGAEAQYSVADSRGTLLPFARFASSAISSTDFLEAFVIEAPPAETIRVTLDAGPSDARLDYSFVFTNGRTMAVSASPFQAGRSSPIQIIARIVGEDGQVIAGGAEPFSCQVDRGEEVAEPVSLFDDGSHGDESPNDGIFAGEYAGTARTGSYSVTVTGTRTIGSERVERVGTGFFVVSAGGDASFSGELTETPVDADGDGLYELLRFEQPIAFANDGVFMVIADLVDSEGTVMSTLRWMYANNEGVTRRTAELSVAGADLVRLDKEGPWRLTDFRIAREDVGARGVARRPVHVTNVYPLSAFERPPPPRFFLFTPDRGPHEGGYEVTLMGRELSDTTEVSVGGAAATFDVRDDSTLGVVIPRLRRSLSEPLWVEVRVTTRWGACVGPDAFIYEP